MANTEEKVKAFLSDEKKAQVITQNETFLDAVSAGTATPETIAKEFEKAGLPLSTDEARQVKETATKLLNTAPEKLGEIELESTSGGKKWEDKTDAAYDISHIVGAVGAVGGLGCWVAGRICRSQAARAEKKGEKTASRVFSKAANGLDIATGVCLGTSVAGLSVGKGIHWELYK